jgi:uracil-DNA glycosylase
MRGTTSLLRLLFGGEPGVDQGGEMLDDGIHLFDAFALVNYLLCTATGREVFADDKFRGAPRGRSTGAMHRNCGAHLVRVLELLEPTIIVAQGSNVRRWLADALGLPSDGPLVETVAVLGAPVMLVNLIHPSAPSAHWWGRSATSEYLRSVVRPTLRQVIGRRD